MARNQHSGTRLVNAPMPFEELNITETIDARKLLMLVTVAEEKTLASAACRMNLTRSALSHGLKALEEEMGCSLFARAQGVLALSPKGYELLEHARMILKLMHVARMSLR